MTRSDLKRVVVIAPLPMNPHGIPASSEWMNFKLLDVIRILSRIEDSTMNFDQRLTSDPSTSRCPVPLLAERKLLWHETSRDELDQLRRNRWI